MYVEIFNKDQFGPEKPIIVESNEYGIKDRYLAARNFIINTLFDGKVNIDRIITIKVDETVNTILYNNYEKPIKFNFIIDKFIYGRKLLKGHIMVNASNLVTKYCLEDETENSITVKNNTPYPYYTIPQYYYNATPFPVSNPSDNKNDFTYKIDIGDTGKGSSTNNTITMGNLHASVNEKSSQLNIDPAVVSSVLDEMKKMNNPNNK